MFKHSSGVDDENRMPFLKDNQISFPHLLLTLTSWIVLSSGWGGETAEKNDDLNEDASNISLLNAKISGRLQINLVIF